jgi:hypothetical protein
MNNFNLEEVFGLRPSKQDKPSVRLPVKVAAIRKFFSDRYIPNVKIASVLKVSGVLVGNWFSAFKPIPKNREAQLLALKRLILDWESEHGRMFNH